MVNEFVQLTHVSDPDWTNPSELMNSSQISFVQSDRVSRAYQV